MRWDHTRPLPTTRELGVKLLNQPHTHELDVNTLPALLTQPVSQHLLRASEKLPSRHLRQPNHKTHPLNCRSTHLFGNVLGTLGTPPASVA